MFSSKSEQPQKTILQIKQDDKFFCRLLTKESSISNPSFRVAVTIPFVWESQPGTPKHTFSQETLPPLTPPPSYYLNTLSKNPIKKNSRSNLFYALFPKLNLKKNMSSKSSSPSSPYNYSSSSCSSSDSSSSSSSSKVVSIKKIGRRRRFLSYGSSFDFRRDEVEEEATSPNSTLCFGLPCSTSTIANSGFLGVSKR